MRFNELIQTGYNKLIYLNNVYNTYIIHSCMSFSKNLIRFVVASFLLIGFAGYHFIKAYDESVWFPPESGSIAPQNNVAIPINTGSSTQTKTGNLLIGNNLGLFGTNPAILFVNNDLTVPKWVQRSDIDGSGNVYMKFLYDRNNDLNASNDYPPPFTMNVDTDAANDHAVFSNEIWAKKYCDFSGENCTDPKVPDTVDLSVIHTYSTINNIRSVSGASCSCLTGDSLTSCNANGNPMINSDPNACVSVSGAVTCTCLSTKPSDHLCTVNLSGRIWGSKGADMSAQRTIQVPEGTPIVIGAWTNTYSSYPDAHFTDRIVYAEQVSSHGGIFDLSPSHTYTHMALGYWTVANFATYGPAYVDQFITHANTPNWEWGYRNTVTIKSGMAPYRMYIRNGLRDDDSFHSNGIWPHEGELIATVTTCQ